MRVTWLDEPDKQILPHSAYGRRYFFRDRSTEDVTCTGVVSLAEVLASELLEATNGSSMCNCIIRYATRATGLMLVAHPDQCKCVLIWRDKAGAQVTPAPPATVTHSHDQHMTGIVQTHSPQTFCQILLRNPLPSCFDAALAAGA